MRSPFDHTAGHSSEPSTWGPSEHPTQAGLTTASGLSSSKLISSAGRFGGASSSHGGGGGDRMGGKVGELEPHPDIEFELDWAR